MSFVLFFSFGSPRTLCDLGFVAKRSHSRVIHMSNCTNIDRSLWGLYDLYHLACNFLLFLLLDCPAMIPQGGIWFTDAFRRLGPRGGDNSVRTPLVHLTREECFTTIRLVTMVRAYLFRLVRLVTFRGPTTRSWGSTIQHCYDSLNDFNRRA